MLDTKLIGLEQTNLNYAVWAAKQMKANLGPRPLPVLRMMVQVLTTQIISSHAILSWTSAERMSVQVWAERCLASDLKAARKAPPVPRCLAIALREQHERRSAALCHILANGFNLGVVHLRSILHELERLAVMASRPGAEPRAVVDAAAHDLLADVAPNARTLCWDYYEALACPVIELAA